MRRSLTAAFTVLLAGTAAVAQPRVVTVSNQLLYGASDDFTRVFANTAQYNVGASSLSTVALTGTSPAVVAVSSDGMYAAGTLNGVAARYSVATGTWTSAVIAAPMTALGNVRDISSNGRYVVGQGSSTSPNSFTGYVTDFGVTPPVTRRLLGNTTTARACAVSDDGTVIVGGETPNTSGGRAGVWRWNTGTSQYDWSYLPNGPIDAGGGIATSTVDYYQISPNGNIIVGNSFLYDPVANRAESWISKWTWNGTSWDRTNLYNISDEASTISSWWTPMVSAPPRFFINGMSDDGNTIVGIMEYSTGGSFYRTGFIYTAGEMHDAYDYLTAQGVDLDAAGYGTYTAGGASYCRLGWVSDVSNDGTRFIGNPQLEVDAPGSWLVELNNPAATCIAPQVITNPTATTNFTACSSSIILNSSFIGTPPFTISWTKDNQPMSTGPTGTGSTLTTYMLGRQLRITGTFNPADAGTFAVTATNACGSATTTNAVVQVDPALVAINNDLCAGADSNVVVVGTNVLTTAQQSACAAWTSDPGYYTTCTAGLPKNERWYKFVPPATASYRFETCGANVDTVLTIYDGCGGLEVACNDNYETGPTTGCTNTRSRISAQTLTGGMPYYIAIGTASGASMSSTSTYNLTIAGAPIPAINDDCSNATPAVLGANAYDTTEATVSPALAALSCASSANVSRDVWFYFTAPEDGVLSASTCPTGIAPPGSSLMTNTVLSFHDGLCGALLACNDNHSPVPSGCGTSLSTITDFPVLANQTIAMRISGNSSTALGAGQLTVDFHNNCPVCAADFNSDGGVGGDDLAAFFVAYESGAGCADVNQDGGIGGDDLAAFFMVYEAGGC